MSSVKFRIEVYGRGNYGCPEMNLMGYNTILQLVGECWKKYDALHEDSEVTNDK